MFLCGSCNLMMFSMIGLNVRWTYLAPENIPSAFVLTLGNKVVLYCSAHRYPGDSMYRENRWTEQNRCSSKYPLWGETTTTATALQHSFVVFWSRHESAPILHFGNSSPSRWPSLQLGPPRQFVWFQGVNRLQHIRFPNPNILQLRTSQFASHYM